MLLLIIVTNMKMLQLCSMETEDKNIANNKPKRIMLKKRGTITATKGDKKVTFRYISASELKSKRRGTYEYLV